MTKTARIDTYLCKYKYRKYKNNQKKEFFHRPELLVKGKSFHPKEEIKKVKRSFPHTIPISIYKILQTVLKLQERIGQKMIFSYLCLVSLSIRR